MVRLFELTSPTYYRPFLLICLVSIAAGCVEPPPRGRFRGTATINGVAHDVAFTIGGEPRGEATLTADLPFAWRMGGAVTDVVWTDGQVTFKLPEALGTGRLSPDGAGWRGQLSLGDGVETSVVLEPAALPQVTVARGAVSSAADGTSISLSVYRPAGPGPFPAAVIVHGGGDSSRDIPGYRFYGEWLASVGVVAAVYDKRGNGESAGNWRTVDFATRAGDVEAVLALLRRTKGVDSERVGLVAVSQGSWVADLVAARDDQLDYVVHVAGPVVPVYEADSYAFERGLKARGAPPAAISGHRALWQAEVSAVTRRTVDAPTRLERAVSKSRRSPWFERFPYEVSNPDGWWWKWYGLVANFDPGPLLGASKARSLWIYGDRDTQSDVARNVSVIQALRDSGQRVAVALIPEAGHGMMVPVDQFGRASGFVAAPPAFFALVLDWIRGPASR